VNIYFVSVTLFLCSFMADAKEPSKVVKVGGTYEVVSIERNKNNFFEIIFKSISPSGSFDELKLESDHVHFSVRKGQEIRLSAEVIKTDGAKAEVSQVLLFLPHPQGVTPVWMLSRKNIGGDLRGSKYIEMHAPQSDYSIL